MARPAPRMNIARSAIFSVLLEITFSFFVIWSFSLVVTLGFLLVFTVFHALLLARKLICVSITASVNKLSARLRLLVEPPLGKIGLARALL